MAFEQMGGLIPPLDQRGDSFAAYTVDSAAAVEIGGAHMSFITTSAREGLYDSPVASTGLALGYLRWFF